MLNDGGDFPSNAEVVIAPSSIFVQSVKDTIRPDIKVRSIKLRYGRNIISYDGLLT